MPVPQDEPLGEGAGRQADPRMERAPMPKRSVDGQSDNAVTTHAEVSAEAEAFEAAVMAWHNAELILDGADDEECLEIWDETYSAASRLESAAEDLFRAVTRRHTAAARAADDA